MAVGRALPQAYLGFLEQHRGVETGVGVGDVQPTVVGHFLLQGADVRWQADEEQDAPLQPARVQNVRDCSVASSLTVYQVFILGNVRKQLVECLVVLYETLQRESGGGKKTIRTFLFFLTDILLHSGG